MARFRSSMRRQKNLSPQCAATQPRWSFRTKVKRSCFKPAPNAGDAGTRLSSQRGCKNAQRPGLNRALRQGDRYSRLGLVRLLRGDTGNVAAGNSNVGQFAVAQLGKFLHGEPISLPVLEKANNR